MSLSESIWRSLFLLSLVSFSWLAMQVVHEMGHVLGAWYTGATVERVVWSPLSFSRTDLSAIRSPLVVVWSGPLFGSLAPLLCWRGSAWTTWGPVARFFAGFCLIANGAYLGLGSFSRVGDCEQLLRHGAPIWNLWCFGAAATTMGFAMWHRLGSELGVGSEARVPTRCVMACVILANGLLWVAGMLWGNSGSDLRSQVASRHAPLITACRTTPACGGSMAVVTSEK